MTLPVRLEITPPRARSARVLTRRAGLLAGRTRRIHVIDRPGRLGSLDGEGHGATFARPV